ncbi:hypothetical protein Mal4_42640 [Maioricimonas rarisocia]|uniref:Uncharacterized protein n=1 Tax=Maioricimonas rarisocia TaxID=2528026 RepID=A0A517ZBU7_9PLAN|nr:hypothetical protein [Maioricimonas rarisocia]QDU39910.1 hypothetical protein Mal4_42640 [Maioricimonas rarisocia]
MGGWLDDMVAVGLLAAIPIAWHARRELTHTTLGTAWIWCAATLLMWNAAWWLTHLVPAVSAGVADQLWYLVSVVSLCPWIAVLGAQRPGVRVWNAFVLLPLIAVLIWPAATLWIRGHVPAQFGLELPMVIGYGLVLVMGGGNYVGTAFAPAAILLMLAQVALLAPAVPFISEALLPTETARRVASLLLMAGAVLAWWIGRRRAPAGSTYDAVWFDFADRFGIVWALRIRERINDRARQEKWRARLEPQGFVWEAALDEQTRRETGARIDHTLRWLLRRFVDEPWLNERLGTSAPTDPGHLDD